MTPTRPQPPLVEPGELRRAVEHHREFCESRPIERMATFESCPFRPWHRSRELRP